jgi:hypothetical protein
VEHGFADDLDGSKALAHEVIVESLQAEAGALFGLYIGTEFHDLELAERVVEVERVGGAALGFDFRDRPALIALVDEEVFGLLDGHGAADAGVHADGDDEASRGG